MHKSSARSGFLGSLGRRSSPLLLLGGLWLAGCGGHAPGGAPRSASHGDAPPGDTAAQDDWSSAPGKQLSTAGQSSRLAKDPGPTFDVDSAEPEAARRGKRRPTGTPEPSEALTTSGQRCLAELSAKKVRYRSLDEQPGIETPVHIEGPIGGITYFAHGLKLIVDCRMGLTLARIAPLFARHDITRVRFSGAYVYRLTRHGKLSLHANGLALDVHELITKEGTSFEVERDFARAVGCGKGVPFINRVACDLRDTGLFRELITPDYDADHKDHLHLGIPRLATTPTTLASSPAGSGKAKTGKAKGAATPEVPVTSVQAPTSVAIPDLAPGSLPEALPEAPSVE